VLFLLESGLKIPNDRLVILLPLPLSSDAFKDAVRQLQVSLKLKETPRSLGHGEHILHLQGLDGKSSCATELRLESTKIIYGHVRFETTPPVPFFMLSLPTIAAPVECREMAEESC
jgi:hypothetical protein